MFVGELKKTHRNSENTLSGKICKKCIFSKNYVVIQGYFSHIYEMSQGEDEFAIWNIMFQATCIKCYVKEDCNG